MSLCEVPGCTASAQYPKIDGQPNAIRARWCDRHALERYPGVRTPLTKQDIDALVDGMPHSREYPHWVEVRGFQVIADELRSDLYLAAGLTAEGERKPERVRLYRVVRFGVPIEYTESSVIPVRYPGASLQVTPGWFVPDGAE